MQDSVARVVTAYRKRAGEGVAPKVFVHSSDGGRYWLWTSFAGYGAAHHLVQPIQVWDKKLTELYHSMQAQMKASGASVSMTGMGVTFYCPKSNPRHMVANLGLQVYSQEGADQVMQKWMQSSRISARQLP